ncbi:MAG: hypothetical protein EXR09_06615 [Acetobacteraceae bacterium]|nr:hypothetical protein [Acetobacteraceae bacterium]
MPWSIVFAGSGIWGIVADKYGRCWAIMIPVIIAIAITPLYLMTKDPTLVVGGFVVQAMFGGSIYGQNPAYLSERYLTEIRAAAPGCVYHQCAMTADIEVFKK